jgi:hypothetical protein
LFDTDDYDPVGHDEIADLALDNHNYYVPIADAADQGADFDDDDDDKNENDINSDNNDNHDQWVFLAAFNEDEGAYVDAPNDDKGAHVDAPDKDQGAHVDAPNKGASAERPFNLCQRPATTSETFNHAIDTPHGHQS